MRWTDRRGDIVDRSYRKGSGIKPAKPKEPITRFLPRRTGRK
jgi:hypothetical protein